MKLRIFSILFLSIFLAGCSNTPTVESPVEQDIKVYVNETEQIFRDSTGHKLKPIVYNGVTYLPYSDMGNYLGYDNQLNGDNIQLTSPLVSKENGYSLAGLETYSVDNKFLTSSFLSDRSYTVFFLWTPWCSDCALSLDTMREDGVLFSDLDVQFVSIPLNLYLVEGRNETTNEQLEEVYNNTDGIAFDYHIYRDNVINNTLASNIEQIPKYFVFDKNGDFLGSLDGGKETDISDVRNIILNKG